MKNNGIIHPRLSALIAELGHTDTFVIADAGLPIAPGVERVDLAFVLGSPSFEDVLDAILAEVEIESALIAREAIGRESGAILTSRFAHAEQVSHEEFKQAAAHARFVVRTGSTLPYANVIVRCGVPF